jgi:putative PIN family toxin of toxin-antitoxin system
VSSFFGGNPGKIISLWKTGNLTLCLTNAILEEYIEVIIRMGLANEDELKELFKLFRTGFNSSFVAKTPKISICEDSHDNKFIEAAAALEAKFIISGDNHLKKIKKYTGIKILSPRDFLNNYKKNP